MNLVDVALSSGGDMEQFWKIFDERLDLCYRALMCRHNRLKGTLSDAAPILWQYGAMRPAEEGRDRSTSCSYGGYSTISLGYAGLYECVKYMTGKSHTDPAATPFALEVMQPYERSTASTGQGRRHIGFGLYGTPLESTTYKFAKCLQKRFGIIPGVTDKGYITNSYHVHVTEQIDAFCKLAFESQFQALSTGGAISYVEVPNMQNNFEAVLEVIKFIYDNIMYAELNTKSDYCQVCGYDGEIQIRRRRDGKLVWTCPNCGNQRSGQDERGPAHLRLHRHPVLEPGPHPGDQGARAASAEFSPSGREESAMHYGQIKYLDVANGIGVRTTLFVSGCTNHCKNCFQPETWDFCYGQEFTSATADAILESLRPAYVRGLTLLGGEPFEPENQRELVKLLRRVRAECPGKDVWAFTGFRLDDDLRRESHARCEVTDELLSMIDVLVDGRYVDELRNLSLQFRGSSNQRLIDLNRTREAGKIILWEEK